MQTSDDFALIAQNFNYSPEDIMRIARNAILAAGAESEVKQKLLRKFDQAAGRIVERL